MLDRLWSAGDGTTSRLASLELLGAKVMITDADRTITYVNQSALALMRAAETELKQELPRFSVDRLIGSSIDMFCQDASLHGGVFAVTGAPRETTIRLGQQAFDLRVTPLTEKARHTGFAVEWSDARARLLNLDYAAQLEAISRTQAVISFSPDGTIRDANENFLTALGYKLDEVVGRKHAMFVEPAYRDSRAYAEFWQRLGAGEHQAGQYKRVAKGGRPVWIEGRYNPILDDSGKVCKVVKFAVEITAQIKRLSDLKSLIDENFAEINGAIDLAKSEAGSASLAASRTSSNVRSVAESAEQLAASVGEIARSMSKSRASTENAFEQAVAVGQNTQTLAKAASAMTGIVELIRNVASQINLLALNATIEAARAGEAGKGFAVVASEVKNLAVQAARATEQISSEIDNIQATSSTVAGSLDAIREAISTVREQVTLTASAVEEQNAVTCSMSADMQSASSATATVSANIEQIASAIQQTMTAITKTEQAAQILVR